MSDNVWDQHEFLYHYTTQSGLESILSTQSLHATHYKYLNDRNEMFQLKPRLVETVRPSVRKAIKGLSLSNAAAMALTEKLGGLESASVSQSQKLIDVLYRISFGEEKRTKFFEPYIMSFCGHKEEYERKNGLLSQWRAYAGQAGFAIVFRSKPLCNLILREPEVFAYSACHIGDVVYDGKVEDLQKEFGEFLGALEELYPRILANAEPNIPELFVPFVSCTSRFKHRGFSEESEVRAVLSPVSKAWRRRAEKESPEEYKAIVGKVMKIVRFKSGFVPYIEVKCRKSESLPIEKIIVGPSSTAENIKAKLDSYLELQGLGIDVTISDTPLC